MKISILCIGDELLKGITINTNQAFIGQELLSQGIIAEHSLVVADEALSLTNALDYLFSTSDVVVTTGGLGPTADDMTKQVIAEYLGLSFVQDAPALANLNKYWSKRHERNELPDYVADQAMVIENSTVLQNGQGTAPGMWLKVPDNKFGASKYLTMLPGPPREMGPMFTDGVLPLLHKMGSSISFNKLYYIAGIAESLVEVKMQPIIEELKNLSVAYCASYDGVKLFLKSDSEDSTARAEVEVNNIFANNILPENHTDLAEDVVRLLSEKNLTLSTAESCTGGKIAGRITDVPGSSAIFPGGIVTYSNEWKEKELGVSKQTLEEFGAVSEQCVTELVNNLMIKSGTNAGISVSGIAGPTGGTADKPVGLVYVAVRLNDICTVKRYEFTGNRQSVRDRTVSKALNTLRELLVAE